MIGGLGGLRETVERFKPEVRGVEVVGRLNRRPITEYINSIVLIGGGGIGGRILPPLVKMLPEGMRVTVVDDDRVEERNLLRQHFHPRDVGRFKAEVLAERYTSERNPVEGIVGRVDEGRVPEFCYYRDLIIGAVDSRRTRAVLLKGALEGYARFYIDAGNEGQGGQVVLAYGIDTDYETGAYCWYAGWKGFMDIFNPELDPPEREGCGRVIDTQTVGSNLMASSLTLNLVSEVLYGGPLVCAGVRFSTLNNVEAVPFRYERNGEFSL